MDEAFQQGFGRIVVEPARRRLLVDGEPAKIGARAFDLLMALIERRDRVVSKDELLDLVWPNVTVEEGNLQVQIAALRRLLGADAIATVPGRGYQFVAPEASQSPGERPTSEPQPADVGVGAASARGWLGVDWRLWGVGAAVLVALVIVGGWGLRSRGPASSGKPSLAAMPFVNVSGDSLSGQLAKGVTTDIATDFSRLRDIDVIADSVTASMNRPDLDAREVAKDLKVQYVLTGAVQREGDLVQVSAQVTDGATGASVWSNRWQAPTAGDLLALQADVADGVASTLGSRNFFVMRAIDAAKAKAPEARTATIFMRSAMPITSRGPRTALPKRSAISTPRSPRTRGSVSSMSSGAGPRCSTRWSQAGTTSLRSRKWSATSARRLKSIRSTPSRMSRLQRILRWSTTSPRARPRSNAA
jgi:TolB-like protein/DNA-binding winged helix-turn-helix (wHTH) protein